jgi:metal-responsive CopG/Arc/MetJ family transcriptional regulator
MARSTKILNISLSEELYRKIATTAEEESRTKSDLVREAFRQYDSNKRWAKIREWGDETARKMGIRDEIDIEKILHDK